MSVFKCKMCGGTIEFEQGATVGVCDSCGTKQTLPRLDDDKKANLYDRANHFRRNNDFDKAMGIYEQILNEDSTDAEAYWSLVLCRYGIEYVEDPQSHKRVPTVNRAQFTSIYMDEDYKSALQYADDYQKQIYEEEAKTIDDIQKGILEISSKEEPFDVFICYKETDNNGRRTQESVLANDLYHQLTQEGFKVFFSRITLEDKLGVAYEPYIFAALNSAKVMVVVGTKPEFFNSVWVKNEWSRYLALIKNGAKKILIPAYRDMDPYDLPEEFSHLQAQDMSKLGFMQDLIRGIKKIVSAEKNKNDTNATVSMGGAGAESLIKRAFIFIEDKDWENAEKYLENALDIEPENANGYLGKLLIELHLTSKEQLMNCDEIFDESSNYQRVIRYADIKLKTEIIGYADAVKEKKEKERCENIYAEALSAMNSANDEPSFNDAAKIFEQISDYSDANTKYDYCLEQAEICRKEAIYLSACALTTREVFSIKEEIKDLSKALEQFDLISDYKDSSDKKTWCKARIEELEKKSKRVKKRNAKITIITICSIGTITVFMLILFNVIIPTVKYNNAGKEYNAGNYETAFSIYNELDDYKDSSSKATLSKYMLAEELFNSENYQEALFEYVQLANYEDSSTKAIISQYYLAETQFESKQYKDSYENYKAVKDYSDAKEKIKESGLLYATTLIEEADYASALTILKEIGNYSNCSELRNKCNTELAKASYDSGKYEEAIDYYSSVDEYDKNADFYLDSCYKYAKELLSKKSYYKAIRWFKTCEDYSDSAEQIKVAKYAYINDNKNNTDETTYEYLKELKEENYKDTASIFTNLYAWKVEIIANDDEEDDTTSMASISKYSTWYFHVSLSGGEPGAKTIVKHKMTYPDGDESDIKAWDNEWGKGYSGTCWSSYNTPVYGKQGTLSLTVYDGDNNVIGTKSVKITG